LNMPKNVANPENPRSQRFDIKIESHKRCVKGSCVQKVGGCPKCSTFEHAYLEEEYSDKMSELMYKILWNEKRLFQLVDELELRNWSLRQEAKRSLRQYNRNMARGMVRCAYETHEDDYPCDRCQLENCSSEGSKIKIT
jgi:hypothetical protein